MLVKHNLSIVIPTYNRKETLIKCLDSYLNQDTDQDYEIIVVDDGSTDGTGDLLMQTFRNEGRVRYFRQENSGPAAARNLGIENAGGDVILFTDDDIIADKSLLHEHLAWHDKYPAVEKAVLGYTTWSPDVTVTPFMYWLEHGGGQFAYDDLEGGETASHSYFYTCNLSLKKEFLTRYGTFDTQFRMAMWEDVELALRLSKHGLQLLYNKDAVALHFREVSLKDSAKREFNAGRYLVLFHAKHPEEETVEGLLRPHNPMLPLDQSVIDALIEKYDAYEPGVDPKEAAKDCAWFYAMVSAANRTRGILHELYFRDLLSDEQFSNCRLTVLPFEGSGKGEWIISYLSKLSGIQWKLAGTRPVREDGAAYSFIKKFDQVFRRKIRNPIKKLFR